MEASASHKEAVQGTNDHVTLSKAYLAECGFFKDEFVIKITGKQKLETQKNITEPSIALLRTTYFRVFIIDYIVGKFNEETGARGQIISLGAGYDTRFFRLKSANTFNGLYVEVDFPEVVMKKMALIEGNGILKSILKDSVITKDHQRPLLRSKNYILIGLNLDNISQLTSLLVEFGLSLNRSTAILTEFVLPYLEERSSTQIIQWAASSFENAIFVSHDPVYPTSSYMKINTKYFEQRGSPWKGCYYCPTPEAHIQRYINLGWTKAIAGENLSIYYNTATKNEVMRMINLVFSDMHEAFYNHASHLAFSCGLKGNLVGLLKELKFDHNEMECSTHVAKCSTLCRLPQGDSEKLIKRYAQTAVFCEDDAIFLLYGGYNLTSSLADTLVCCHVNQEEKSGIFLQVQECFTDGDSPGPLKHGSLVKIVDNDYILFGGLDTCDRTKNDTYLLREKGLVYNWTLQKTRGSLPPPRWRHSADKLQKGEGSTVMIVYGGRNSKGQPLGDCHRLELNSMIWSEQYVTGDSPKPRHSHSTVVWKDSILMYGGVLSDERLCNKLYHATMMDLTVYFKELETIPSLPARCSSSSVVHGDSLILLGGADWYPGVPEVVIVNLINLTASFVQLQLPEEPIWTLGWTCGLLTNDEKSKEDHVNIVSVAGGCNCKYFNEDEAFFTPPTIIKLALD